MVEITIGQVAGVIALGVFIGTAFHPLNVRKTKSYDSASLDPDTTRLHIKRITGGQGNCRDMVEKPLCPDIRC